MAINNVMHIEAFFSLQKVEDLDRAWVHSQHYLYVVPLRYLEQINSSFTRSPNELMLEWFGILLIWLSQLDFFKPITFRPCEW